MKVTGKFSIHNVEEVAATMAVTMTVEDWNKVKMSLEASGVERDYLHPSSKLQRIVSQLIVHANETFHATEDFEL